MLIKYIAWPENQDLISYKCKKIETLNPMFLAYSNETHQYY